MIKNVDLDGVASPALVEPSPESPLFDHMLARIGMVVERLLRSSLVARLPSHQPHNYFGTRWQWGMHLPRASDLPGSHTSSHRELQALTARFPILHTDDENTFRVLVQLMLQREGFTVLSEARAERAIEYCRYVPISLVITDIMKPDINGVELARRLRADPVTTHIPVMFLTACTDRQNLAEELDPVAFLSKPITPLQLRSVIYEALARRGNWRIPPDIDPVLCRRLGSELGRMPRL